jgi:hypothetical protein
MRLPRPSTRVSSLRTRAIRSAGILAAIVFTTACSTTYAQGRSYPYPNYPDGQRGGVSRGGYYNPAFDRGFDDGYRQGLDAARDGDRRDVRRESWYRSGDRGYDRRFGSRDAYRRVYRDGFASGYDQGYRDGRYRNNGRYRRW